MKRSALFNLLLSCCIIMISGLIAHQIHSVINTVAGPRRMIVDPQGNIHDKTWQQVPEYASYPEMMRLLETKTSFFEKPRSIDEINQLKELFRIEVTRYYDYVAGVNQYYHANLPPRLKRAFKHYIKTLELGIHDLDREIARRSRNPQIPQRPGTAFQNMEQQVAPHTKFSSQ